MTGIVAVHSVLGNSALDSRLRGNDELRRGWLQSCQIAWCDSRAARIIAVSTQPLTRPVRRTGRTIPYFAARMVGSAKTPNYFEWVSTESSPFPMPLVSAIKAASRSRTFSEKVRR